MTECHKVVFGPGPSLLSSNEKPHSAAKFQDVHLQNAVI